MIGEKGQASNRVAVAAARSRPASEGTRLPAPTAGSARYERVYEAIRHRIRRLCDSSRIELHLCAVRLMQSTSELELVNTHSFPD